MSGRNVIQICTITRQLGIVAPRSLADNRTLPSCTQPSVQPRALRVGEVPSSISAPVAAAGVHRAGDWGCKERRRSCPHDRGTTCCRLSIEPDAHQLAPAPYHRGGTPGARCRLGEVEPVGNGHRRRHLQPCAGRGQIADRAIDDDRPAPIDDPAGFQNALAWAAAVLIHVTITGAGPDSGAKICCSPCACLPPTLSALARYEGAPVLR